MSVASGPKVVTDGLIFSYDMNNNRSWRGRPTTNIYPIDSYSVWPSVSYHYWNGSAWVVNGTYTHPGVDGPQGVFIGKVCKYTSGALAATWSGNSYAYMLKSAIMTNGQQYAMSTYAYVSPDCNIDGMNASIEGASVSAMSGYNTYYNLNQKGTWQRFGLTGIAPATSINFIPVYPYKVGVTNGTFTGFFMYGGPMVEVGTFPSAVTDTGRDSSQAIIDLTGNTIWSVNNLAYSSDGTFSFNGSNSWIESPTSSLFDSQNITMESWCKPTTTSQNGFLFEKGQVNTQYSNFFNGNDVFYFRTKGLSSEDLTFTSSTYITVNQWNHIVCTVGNGVKVVYINGVACAQVTGLTGTMPTGQTNQYVGKYGSAGTSYPFSGSIAVSRVYNRVLSAAEVQQNFNALRSRYGI